MADTACGESNLRVIVLLGMEVGMHSVNLDYDPRNKIMEKLPNISGEPEMTLDESAFLCGLLNEIHPSKILEVGVAAGSATAIMLQCLEDSHSEYEMHSVDISTRFYRDRTRETGFLAKIAKEFLNHPNHHIYTGRNVASCLEEIGQGIDFLIMDTVHFLPGEILDFLVILPFLKENSVVCLHDVAVSHYVPVMKSAHSCSVLFSNVTSEKKFMNFTSDEHYPNIAAFQVTKETRKHIIDIFLSLILRWYYIPSNADISLYVRAFQSTYGRACCKIFDEAVRMNITSFRWELREKLGKISSDSNVLLYGAGLRGYSLYPFVKELKNIHVLQWADRDAKYLSSTGDLDIVDPKEIRADLIDYALITTENRHIIQEITDDLMGIGISQDCILPI